MANTLYNVVFCDIKPGMQPEAVRRNFVHLFRVAPAAVDRFFKDSPSIIKENVDRHTAEKYKAAVEKAGGVCRIEPVTGDELKLEMVEQDGKVANHSTIKSTVQCPHCGFDQEVSNECIRCGLVFDRYYKQTVPDRSSEIGEDKKNRPKITPLITPAPKKRRKRMAIWMILILATGIGIYFGPRYISERDESPLPNLGAEMEAVLPDDITDILSIHERGFRGSWSRRIYLADVNGDPSPLIDDLSPLCRFMTIAETLEGARTLMVVDTGSDFEDETGIQLKAALIDISEPSRFDVLRAKTIPPGDQYPNGATLVSVDSYGTQWKLDWAESPAGVVTSLIRMILARG